MSTTDLIGSVVSAFILGCGYAFGAAFIAVGDGHMSRYTIPACVVAGALTAAKDYRACKKMPPVENGNTAK